MLWITISFDLAILYFSIASMRKILFQISNIELNELLD